MSAEIGRAARGLLAFLSGKACPTGSGRIIYGWMNETQRWALHVLRRCGFSPEQVMLAMEHADGPPDDGFVLVRLPTDGKFRRMAEALVGLWPEGMREVDGRMHPWADTVPNVEARLRRLWVARDLDAFGEDDVMAVAREYVRGFLDDPRYMLSLPSWILKVTKEDGMRRQTSMLADLLGERGRRLADGPPCP